VIKNPADYCVSILETLDVLSTTSDRSSAVDILEDITRELNENLLIPDSEFLRITQWLGHTRTDPAYNNVKLLVQHFRLNLPKIIQSTATVVRERERKIDRLADLIGNIRTALASGDTSAYSAAVMALGAYSKTYSETARLYRWLQSKSPTTDKSEIEIQLDSVLEGISSPSYILSGADSKFAAAYTDMHIQPVLSEDIQTSVLNTVESTSETKSTSEAYAEYVTSKLVDTAPPDVRNSIYAVITQVFPVFLDFYLNNRRSYARDTKATAPYFASICTHEYLLSKLRGQDVTLSSIGNRVLPIVEQAAKPAGTSTVSLDISQGDEDVTVSDIVPGADKDPLETLITTESIAEAEPSPSENLPPETYSWITPLLPEKYQNPVFSEAVYTAINNTVVSILPTLALTVEAQSDAEAKKTLEAAVSVNTPSVVSQLGQLPPDFELDLIINEYLRREIPTLISMLREAIRVYREN